MANKKLKKLQDKFPREVFSAADRLSASICGGICHKDIFGYSEDREYRIIAMYFYEKYFKEVLEKETR